MINACEALTGRENGISVSTAFNTETNMACITVRDQGVGMTTDHVRKATIPFFTTRSSQNGTGLGLAICQRIVDKHKGVLDIVSVQDKGTTVMVNLPLS